MNYLPRLADLFDKPLFASEGLADGLCVDEDGLTKLAWEREEASAWFRVDDCPGLCDLFTVDCGGCFMLL